MLCGHVDVAQAFDDDHAGEDDDDDVAFDNEMLREVMCVSPCVWVGVREEVGLTCTTGRKRGRRGRVPSPPAARACGLPARSVHYTPHMWHWCGELVSSTQASPSDII
jgi:hypothetical protein